ncbi:MAG: enoyl-CoA hydratase/isomerase family protein [bacterium]|nr:enoyl-CoA hydratase/isomerase family protein [bacterium]
MTVLTTKDHPGAVRLLTLDHAPVNAFDLDLMMAVSDAIREAEATPEVRAVVITGSGSVFSAGLDFKAMMQVSAKGPEAAKHFARTMHQTFMDVWTCTCPTVAAVNGSSIAAGYLLGAACDFRIVAEGPGEHGLNEIRFGAGFPAVAVEIGRSVMGPQVMQSLLSGELFDWKRGLDNGSFSSSETPDTLLTRALDKARQLGEFPQPAYAHAKAQLIEPFTERVLAESEEQKDKTDAIFTSEQTVASLMKYIKSVLEKS